MAQKTGGPPARKRKEEVEKPQNHERWLLTYADMITLLMVFFVVLYAMSKVDQEKFNALSESLAAAFNMPGVQLQEGKGGHSAAPSDATIKPPPGTGLSPKVSPKKNPFLEKATSTLQSSIKTGAIRMNTEARGVIMALSGDVFFAKGSAELDEGAIGTLTQVADLVRDLPNDIVVEGHTDAVPLEPNEKYGSNLMLSAMRAVNVANILELLNVPKERIAATGYGDAKPARPNDTPEGRSFNRRVEILIRFEEE